MNDYQENLLDHYKNPRNFGKPNWHPTHTAKLQNLACGDEIEFYLLVKDNTISEIAFTGEGCSISIGSASILSEYLRDKDYSILKTLNRDVYIKDILHLSLTPSRVLCATLPLETVISTSNLSH